jgi:hypothetical protein
MKRFSAWVLAAGVLLGFTGTASADADKDAKAILDKAIKAMGGEEKLGTLKAFTWKTKGTITFGGNDNPFTGQTTAQGLDHYRAEFEGDFGGNMVKGVTVINGDKGWRKIGEMAMDIDVAVEKRNIYLQLVPQMLLPLKEKSFKIEPAGEEKVGDKPALGLKIIGPDGKDFTLYFDKETGLPVKQVAKVTGFMGDEFTQETSYGNYKDFGGIKKATKIESKRNGEKFVDIEFTDFKVLDKVDPKTFAEPE